MASLDTVLTIRFDPTDRELLERVVEALDQHQTGAAPAPPAAPADEPAQDDEPRSQTLSPTEALEAIANYLSVPAIPEQVMQAVMEFGHDLQEARAALEASKAKAST